MIFRVSWVKATKTVVEEKFVPSVVEPSFGIGRVLYSLMEHSFYVRKSDEQVSTQFVCHCRRPGQVD